MGKIKIFKVKDRTVGGRRRPHFSGTKVKSYVVNTGLSNAMVKKPSAFSFDAIQDALESVFRSTSTSTFQLQDLTAAISVVPTIITGPPYRPQVLPKDPGMKFEERIICIAAMKVIKIQASAPSKCPIIAAGFTSRDPASLEVSNLPNQASKLLERPDYWQFTVFDLNESRRILMKIKPGGEILVMFGEKDYRVFTVDFSQPLWFFIQASGGVKTVYFHHTTSSYNYQKPEKPLKRLNGATAGTPVTEFGEPDKDFKFRAMAEFEAVNFNNMEQLTLHKVYSYGINLYCSLGQIDIDKGDKLFYAFSAYPAKVDQVFKIVAKRSKSEIKLHIGFTSRDPASLDLATLPGAAGLRDRPDYWIYISFDLDRASRVMVKMKNHGEVITMFGEEDWRTFHVDTTSPVWLFIHASEGVYSLNCHTTVSQFVYKKIDRPRAQPTTSSTQKSTAITPKTVSPTPGPSRNISSNLTSIFIPNITVPTQNVTQTTQNVTQNIRNECVICYDGQVNCALVNCGHTCLCYECAMKMKRRSQNCPMCRQEISNVIKLYMN